MHCLLLYVGLRQLRNPAIAAQTSQFAPGEAYSLAETLGQEAIYRPQSLNLKELTLTALGGTFRHDTSFVPPASARHITGKNLFDALSIEQWQHWAVLGRDVFVEVVYKGFLFPTGHRASLVKVTERTFLRAGVGPNGPVKAYLKQRLYVRCGEATFLFSFSAGFCDFDFSVTVNRKEDKIGNDQSKSSSESKSGLLGLPRCADTTKGTVETERKNPFGAEFKKKRNLPVVGLVEIRLLFRRDRGAARRILPMSTKRGVAGEAPPGTAKTDATQSPMVTIYAHAVAAGVVTDGFKSRMRVTILLTPVPTPTPKKDEPAWKNAFPIHDWPRKVAGLLCGDAKLCLDFRIAAQGPNAPKCKPADQAQNSCIVPVRPESFESLRGGRAGQRPQSRLDRSSLARHVPMGRKERRTHSG